MYKKTLPKYKYFLTCIKGENARETQRRFFETYQKRISVDTILRIKTLFRETKTLKDRRRNIRRQNIRNLAIVQYFRINPMSSIPQRRTYRTFILLRCLVFLSLIYSFFLWGICFIC